MLVVRKDLFNDGKSILHVEYEAFTGFLGGL